MSDNTTLIGIFIVGGFISIVCLAILNLGNRVSKLEEKTMNNIPIQKGK